MHKRRARPTLRLLAEDLNDGWSDPYPRRMLDQGDYDALSPVSGLPHPLIKKAADCLGDNPDEDQVWDKVRCCTAFDLVEVRLSQWRGGVWADPETGVRWLVVAGLSKGGHQDHEDFFERVERENANGAQRWLPTDLDIRIMKRETAAALTLAWELAVQESILRLLADVNSGGTASVEVGHPVDGQEPIGTVSLSVTTVREDGYEADEIEVVFETHQRYKGSDLEWQLMVRVLISLEPPEQGWDRLRNTFTNIGDLGRWSSRVEQLQQLVDRGELGQSEPGTSSHYAHRDHLAGGTIDGTAVRALCGAFFVPTRDHKALPVCPECERNYRGLPV